MRVAGQGRTLEQQRAAARLVDRHGVAAPDEVQVLGLQAGVQGTPRGHSGALQRRLEVGPVGGFQPGGQRRVDLVAIGQPTGLGRPLRAGQGVGRDGQQRRPRVVVGRAHGEPRLGTDGVVGAAIQPPRCMVRRRVAGRLGGTGPQALGQQEVADHRRHRLELGDVDPAADPGAVAGEQPGHRPERDEPSGQVVGMDRHHPAGRIGAVGPQPGEPADRPGARAVALLQRPRPAVAVQLAADDDQARVDPGHVVPAEAEALDHAGRIVLDQHVELRQQAVHQVAALRRGEVGGQRPLVAVRAGERRVHVAAHHPPLEVGAAGGLDLHHVGAPLAEHAAGFRGGDAGTDLQHAQPAQRQRGRARPHVAPTP